MSHMVWNGWRRWALVALILAVVPWIRLTSQPTSADIAESPPQQFSPVQLSGSWIKESGATLSDLDGNGTLEILFGGRTVTNGNATLGCEGKVYAYNTDGSLKWQTTVRADINSSPATADLNGDGVKDVVVGMGAWMVDGASGSDLQYDCPGGVVALNGQNGNILWYFDTADYGEWDGPNGRLDGVYSSPAIADLDGDGALDIVFGAWDHCIYRLDQNGNALWNGLPGTEGRCNNRGYWNRDTVWASPALADLNDDGKLEIVIGADISLGGPEGYLYVMDAAGTVLARRQFPQVFFSSPAVADLDGNGVLDIAIGTGIADRNPGVGFYVVFAHYDPAQADISTRLVVDWQPAVAGRVYASPAVGDINGDGYLDVAVQSYLGDTWPWWPMHGYALDFKNRSIIFDTWLCDGSPSSYNYQGIMFGSPLIADVAGSSSLEVLFTMRNDVVILNANGTYYTYAASNCAGSTPPTTSYNLSTGGGFYGTPAVGDLDGDGDYEIVAAGYWNNLNTSDLRGGLYAWTGFKKGAAPWPMFRQNAQHTASLLVPSLQVSPASIVIPFGSGQTPAAQQIVISNLTPGTSFDWSASINWAGSEAANWFTLSALSGTVSQSTEIALEVVAAQTVDPGTYQAVITIIGEDAENSPQQITVQYIVPPPTLLVNPSGVLFLLAPGESDVEALRVLTSNTGGGGAIQWTARESLSWLFLSPLSGDTASNPYLTLTVDSTGMSEGFHTGAVALHATTAGVTNPDQTVEVTFYFGSVQRIYIPLALRKY